MKKEKNDQPKNTPLSEYIAREIVGGNRSVIQTALNKADAELAKLAAEGDIDAIKLLAERVNEREELKLRKELFGV